MSKHTRVNFVRYKNRPRSKTRLHIVLLDQTPNMAYPISFVAHGHHRHRYHTCFTRSMLPLSNRCLALCSTCTSMSKLPNRSHRCKFVVLAASSCPSSQGGKPQEQIGRDNKHEIRRMGCTGDILVFSRARVHHVGTSSVYFFFKILLIV